MKHKKTFGACRQKGPEPIPVHREKSAAGRTAIPSPPEPFLPRISSVFFPVMMWYMNRDCQCRIAGCILSIGTRLPAAEAESRLCGRERGNQSSGAYRRNPA